jgi:non-ribosomal peptide synthetase component F
VVLGSIISNRSRREVEQTVGNFGSNVFLRLDFSDRPDFRTLLRRVHALLLAAHEHQEVPLERLLDRNGAPGLTGQLPLFHVMFLLRDSPYERNLELPGIAVEATSIKTGLSTLDLSLDLTEAGETVVGALEYKTALFEPETATLLRDAFIHALDAAVSRPGSAESTLRLPDGLGGRAMAVRPEPAAAPGEPDRLVTEAERLLGSSWSQALKLDRVGPQDNFFDLGGDSLLAMLVIERLERETGHRFEPLDLASQTLRQLAALCAVERADRDPPQPDSLWLRVMRRLTRNGHKP